MPLSFCYRHETFVSCESTNIAKTTEEKPTVLGGVWGLILLAFGSGDCSELDAEINLVFKSQFWPEIKRWFQGEDWPTTWHQTKVSMILFSLFVWLVACSVYGDTLSEALRTNLSFSRTQPQAIQEQKPFPERQEPSEVCLQCSQCLSAGYYYWGLLVQDYHCLWNFWIIVLWSKGNSGILQAKSGNIRQLCYQHV